MGRYWALSIMCVSEPESQPFLPIDSSFLIISLPSFSFLSYLLKGKEYFFQKVVKNEHEKINNN